MRTLIFILMLALSLTACAGKNDTPEGGEGSVAVPESEEVATQAEGDPAATDEESSIFTEEMLVDPVGDVRLADGTVLELTKFEKLGKYYIYISGKLNGRSSTVISFTRLDDLKHWKAIIFKDQHTFTVITRTGKELNFADSYIYIGSDSHETYTFYSTPSDGYQPEEVTVNKKDVRSINISEPTEE